MQGIRSVHLSVSVKEYIPMAVTRVGDNLIQMSLLVLAANGPVCYIHDIPDIKIYVLSLQTREEGGKITQSQVFTAWGISQSWNVIGTTTEYIAASPLSVKSIYELRAFHKLYIEDWQVHVQLHLSEPFRPTRFISCTPPCVFLYW